MCVGKGFLPSCITEAFGQPTKMNKGSFHSSLCQLVRFQEDSATPKSHSHFPRSQSMNSIIPQAKYCLILGHASLKAAMANKSAPGAIILKVTGHGLHMCIPIYIVTF